MTDRVPPRFSHRVLAWSAARLDLPELVPDAEEVFAETVALEGKARARRWFRREARSALRRALFDRQARAASGNRFVSGFGRELRFAARRVGGAPARALTFSGLVGLGIASAAFMVQARSTLLDPDLGLGTEVRFLTWRTEEGRQSRSLPMTGRESWLREAPPGATALVPIWSIRRSVDTPLGRLDGRAERVLPGYFTDLGGRLAVGRDVASEGEVVLSWDTWTRYWAGDRAVVGSPVRVGQTLSTVVGVAVEGFVGPRCCVTPDLWAVESPGSERVPGVVLVVGLSDPEVLVHALSNASTGDPLPPARVEDPAGAFGPETDLFADTLGVLVTLTMTLWFATLLSGANLMLTDVLERGGEVRIRSALGATHRDASARVLAETTLLACLAALLAGVIAFGMNQVAPWFLPFFGPDSPFDIALGRDGLVTTVVLSGLAAVVCAVPAGIVAMGLSRSAEVRRGPGRRDLSSWGLAGQLAIAAMLMSVTIGLTAQIRAFDGDWVGFSNGSASVDYLSLPEDESTQRVATLLSAPSGVRYAVTSRLPVYGARGDSVRADGDAAWAAIESVTPGYFEVVGSRLEQGVPARDSDEAVISADLARDLGLSSPLGARLVLVDSVEVRVVGLVGAATWGSGENRPTVYRGWSAEGVRSAVLLGSRAGGGTPEVATRLDVFAGSGISLRPFETLGGLLVRSRVLQVFRSRLATFIGLLGLIVCVGGTYAHFLRWVRVRESEIAIRTALGARALELGRELLSAAARLIAPGVALGIGFGWLFIRVMFSSFGGMEQAGSALGMAGTIVFVVAVGALIPPFLRTQRMSPLSLLRERA